MLNYQSTISDIRKEPNLVLTGTRLRLRCESAITDDMGNAAELKVEDDLWDFHSRVNNWYRNRVCVCQF